MAYFAKATGMTYYQFRTYAEDRGGGFANWFKTLVGSEHRGSWTQELEDYSKTVWGEK